jgi:prefoldin subunit 5
MSRIKLFEQFISEMEITDTTLIGKIERIKSLKDKLSEMNSEIKSIEVEIKEFDAEIKPIFEMMKEVEDRLATAQNFALKITKYGHKRTDIGWKNVVDQSLEQVDEAARAIITSLMETNKKIVDVKFSYEIEKLNESFFEKFKSMITKSIDKLKSVFSKKTMKIDAANQKLEKLAQGLT